MNIRSAYRLRWSTSGGVVEAVDLVLRRLVAEVSAGMVSRFDTMGRSQR